MKIRLGFVSNSSSSSFVVIGSSWSLDSLDRDNGELIISDKRIFCEFGWGPAKIRHDIEARVMFAYLQSEYKPEWKVMLEKVIKDNSNIKKIVWDVNQSNDVYAYIDHQSSAIEQSNTEIFDSEEILKSFIFRADSEIVLDNDNH